MVALWKYANLHVVHVIQQVDASKLNNEWQSSEDQLISLKDGIINYLSHLKLHLSEIDDLIN